MNQNFDYISKDYTDDHLSVIFAKGYVEHVPVLKNGKLHNIITQKNPNIPSTLIGGIY